MFEPRDLIAVCSVALLLGAAPALAHADAAPVRLGLDELIARSHHSSRARMAGHDTDAARARVDEASAARLPRITATSFLAPSPKIDCVDTLCTETVPNDTTLQLSGVFGGATVQITQPLYTFGKLTAVREAARAGVTAQRALEDELAGDLTVEAARAYWGLKLARELVFMLEDGIAELDSAKLRLEERLAEAGGDATIQDRLRLETIMAEARIQLSDARTAEATALAGVRAIADDADIDIDEEPIAKVEFTLGDEDDYIARARTDRPQVRAARAGAKAASDLADFESSQYWPDLALVGQLGFAYAQGVDDAPSAVYSEPYHSSGGGLALVLRWNLEPWTTRARVKRARAQERKAEDLAVLAGTGASMDARTAWAETKQAADRVTAAEDGETAARSWLASVLQADAIGTAETRDLADAYIAWFQMRARLASAIFQWNVATVRLGRATGEFTAGTGRRKEQ